MGVSTTDIPKYFNPVVVSLVETPDYVEYVLFQATSHILLLY